MLHPDRESNSVIPDYGPGVVATYPLHLVSSVCMVKVTPCYPEMAYNETHTVVT